jgi:hypothetical protein
LEEKKADALEMAKEKNEKGKAQKSSEEIRIINFIYHYKFHNHPHIMCNQLQFLVV